MLDRITGNTKFASLAAPPSASDVGPCQRRVSWALALNASMREMLDRDAVMEAVVARRPDAIVDHATALANLSDLEHFDGTFHQPNLLRTRGTDALIAAERW